MHIHIHWGMHIHMHIHIHYSQRSGWGMHKQYQAESLGNQQAPKADEGEEIRDPCVPLSLR